MKDYSLNLEDSKTFVLNYTIKGNEITVNLANGENYVIPYTTENEVKLLEKMKIQVLQSEQFMIKQEKRFSKSWKWAIWDVSILALNVFSVITFASRYNVLLTKGGGMCVSWFVFDIAYRINSMIDSKKNIKDINKNRMLLNNEERQNEKVKENYNILAHTDKKTKEIVHSIPVDQPVFTLNSIDKIKYEELKQILKNIDREEKFGFDYSSESNEKSLVLKKKSIRND